MSNGIRAGVSMAAAAAFVLAGPAALAAPAAQPAAPEAAADAQLLLVHGYGDADAKNRDCNGSTWKNALAYYQKNGGRSRGSMTTIGYYSGDTRKVDGHPVCDKVVGDGKAGNDRPIQDIARDLAKYIDAEYTSKGEPVNIVAHSMGGLITRVALLGSEQGWKDFPHKKLNVNNVVTLSTPHQGLNSNSDSPKDREWKQMVPGSDFLKRLHEKGSELGDSWTKGTDWSVVGSDEDPTVPTDSAIDKGHQADQKYRYKADDADGGDKYKVDHHTVRRYYKGDYYLRYWHASGDHQPHDTNKGWSPLETAFRAATHAGDQLPK